jgi:5,10-methylenetetrahydromethanopterin reductase
MTLSGPVPTGVWFFPDIPGPLIVETIAAAEAYGLAEVWLGDEGPARDPFALLAAAALRTSTIRLGIAVTNPYLRHPATTAASALTVHELSGGRMVLGIGPGGGLALDPAGVPRHRPLDATRNAIRIMRAVANGQATDGYSPAGHAIGAPDLPLFVGARGERFNRLASSDADGVFLGGIPRSRLAPTLGWARSVRPIDAAVYVDAVFDDASREAVRPRLIFAFVDAPEATRARFGIDLDAARDAAAALAAGDDGPARKLVDDEALDDLVLSGTPSEVGQRLAAELRPLRPTSVGLTLLTTDPMLTLERAAAALAVAREEMG